MEEKITIIVPIYRIKEEYLRRCIKSFIEQTSKEFYVILVDDGSPDKCGKICDEYANQYNFIKVIHQENRGVSVARNTGIVNTKTKWLTFVDPDDWIENKTIEIILNKLKNEARGSDIIMYNYVREFENKRNIEILNCNDGYLDKKNMEECKKAPFFKLIQNDKVNFFSINAIWNKVYKTEFLRNANILFIPEARKGQDRLFNADAINSTDKIFYINELLYHYRCYSESVTNRYNPQIISLTNIEINELKEQIKKHNLNYDECLNARICTRLYSCTRLYFFNKSNPKKWKDIKKEVRYETSREPFYSALKNVDYKLLTSKERIFIKAIKRKRYFICYILVKMNEIIK